MIKKIKNTTFLLAVLSLIILVNNNVLGQSFTMQCGLYSHANGFSLKLKPNSNMPSNSAGKAIRTVFTIRYKASLGTATFNLGTNPLGIFDNGSFEGTDNGVVYRYHVFSEASAKVFTDDPFPWLANTDHEFLVFSVYDIANAADELELIQDANTAGLSDYYFWIQDIGNVPNVSLPYHKPKANLNTLPVELLTFSAKPTANATLLTWATASESNNKGFEVMRRLENEKEFKQIGFVNGKGTTTQISEYKFEDKHQATGTAYYMLRQIDFDLTSSNSPIVAVNYSKKNQLFVSLYPNPATDLVHLNVGSEVNTLFVNLYSAEGKLALTKEVKNGESLSVANLPQGLYQIIYTTETGEKGSGKLIIQK